MVGFVFLIQNIKARQIGLTLDNIIKRNPAKYAQRMPEEPS